MAIHDADQNNASNTNQAQPMSEALARNRTEAPNQQAAQSFTNPAKATFSFGELSRLNRSALSRSPAAEVLTKTMEALQTVVPSIRKDFEVKLIPLDNQIERRLSHSVIIIAMRDVNHRDAGVAFHSLILEGSADAMAPKTEMLLGVTIEVIKPTSDAYNVLADQAIEEEVARNYPNSKLLGADAIVVPRGFDLTDKSALHGLTANAALAAQERLDQQIGRPDLVLRNAVADTTLEVRTTFTAGQPQPLDAAGLPFRSDITVALQAVAVNTDKVAVNAERTHQIAQATGFIDFIWDPVESNGYGVAQQYPEPPTRKFRPRFVMTDMHMDELTSMAAQLFSILPVLSLYDGNLWQAAFRARSGVKGIDLQNIGALNIEANMFNETNQGGRGSPIDTKSANFSQEDQNLLLNAAVRTGLGIALDVPECGASTWYNGVFVAASQNQQAYNVLYDELDQLFSGEFSKIFPRGEPLVIAENNRIHLGTYTDMSGLKRDLRDWDLLALYNVLPDDKSVIDQWINSWNNTSLPMNFRLAERLRIIKNLAADVNVTGFARRIGIPENVRVAMAQAARACGLQMRTRNLLLDQAGAGRQAAGLDGRLFGTAQSGLFNNGFNNQQVAGNMFQNGFSNRWGN